MTKDEKIVFYNKIEKALLEEYPVLKEGMTHTQIMELMTAIDEKCKVCARQVAIDTDEAVTVEYLEPDLVAKVILQFKKKGIVTEAFPVEIAPDVMIQPIDNRVSYKHAWLGYKEFTVVFPRPIYELADSTDASYIKVNKNTFKIMFKNMHTKNIDINWINVEE